jgi:Cell division protein
MIKELISCIRNLPKHIKTAFQNIIRNNVMSFSSVFAVSITLLLVGVISIVAINIQDMTVLVERELTIYVKMERETPAEIIPSIEAQILNIENVFRVEHSSKDNELNKLIDSSDETMATIYESYRESNPLGDAFIIEVIDGANLSNIKEQVERLDYVRTAQYGGASTDNLINGLKTVRNMGSVSIISLVIVALFMISNTIKITITSRSTEISIMRMVGASNWYIRIPFMIEGLLIGLLGAILPIIIIYFGYTTIYNSMNSTAFVSTLLAIREPNPFLLHCMIVLTTLGSVVGAIGSYFSIKKYLRF